MVFGGRAVSVSSGDSDGDCWRLEKIGFPMLWRRHPPTLCANILGSLRPTCVLLQAGSSYDIPKKLQEVFGSLRAADEIIDEGHIIGKV